MEPLPKVFVVVLNHDGRECLVSCLRSVFSLNYGDFEVVVVDNASRDGSIEVAKGLFPKAHFVLNSENVGFAAGMNVGIRFARSRGAAFVFLLNNDARCEQTTLSRLVSAAQSHERPAVFSPLISYPDGQIWFSGGRLDYFRMRAVHIGSGSRRTEPYKTGYLSGCALFLPAQAFELVGLFDEGYFLYYEDADYSVRARKRGFDLMVVPGAVVIHEERSARNPDKTYWLVRSGLRFFAAHMPGMLRPWMTIYLALRRAKNRFDISRGKKEALPVSSAYADHFAS